MEMVAISFPPVRVVPGHLTASRSRRQCVARGTGWEKWLRLEYFRAGDRRRRRARRIFEAPHHQHAAVVEQRRGMPEPARGHATLVRPALAGLVEGGGVHSPNLWQTPGDQHASVAEQGRRVIGVLAADALRRRPGPWRA